jgi:hypothetical protein
MAKVMAVDDACSELKLMESLLHDRSIELITREKGGTEAE